MAIKYYGGSTVAVANGASAYSANDVVGGILTFDVNTDVGGGTISRITVIDTDSQAAAGWLFLFNMSEADGLTTFADNAAFAPDAADMNAIVTVIDIPSYTTINADDYAESEVLRVFPATDGYLYGYFVVSGTPTYTAANALQVTLWISS